MSPHDIVQEIVSKLRGVSPKSSWGETSLFYNPEDLLPNGVYFCTIKDHDGENDKSSQLNREGVFRVAIGLTPRRYAALFGQKPARPTKGGHVDTGHDFTKTNDLMPHPVYAWMGWAQILSPSKERFEEIFPYIKEAHEAAVVKFNKKARLTLPPRLRCCDGPSRQMFGTMNRGERNHEEGTVTDRFAE